MEKNSQPEFIQKIIDDRLKRCDDWKKKLAEASKLLMEVAVELEREEKQAQAAKLQASFRLIDRR
jgi:hypothetical protein